MKSGSINGRLPVPKIEKGTRDSRPGVGYWHAVNTIFSQELNSKDVRRSRGRIPNFLPTEIKGFLKKRRWRDGRGGFRLFSSDVTVLRTAVRAQKYCGLRNVVSEKRSAGDTAHVLDIFLTSITRACRAYTCLHALFALRETHWRYCHVSSSFVHTALLVTRNAPKTQCRRHRLRGTVCETLYGTGHRRTNTRKEAVRTSI